MEVWQIGNYAAQGVIVVLLFYWLLVFILRVFGSKPLTARWIAIGVMIAYVISVVSLYLLANGDKTPLSEFDVTDRSAIGVAIYCTMLLSINLAVMPFLYWVDKRKALKESETRIPEAALHFFAFVGGGVGAYASQHIFRHKTVKPSFRKVFWVSFVFSVIIYSISIYFLIYGVAGLDIIHGYVEKILHYRI